MIDFNSALYKILGERIRTYRCAYGLSQEELSQKTSIVSNDSISISRTSISNIEVGRHQPPLHTLSLISKALRKDIHSLIPTSNEVMDYLDSEVLNPPDDGSEKNIIELLQKKNLGENTEKNLEAIFKTL